MRDLVMMRKITLVGVILRVWLACRCSLVANNRLFYCSLSL